LIVLIVAVAFRRAFYQSARRASLPRRSRFLRAPFLRPLLAQSAAGAAVTIAVYAACGAACLSGVACRGLARVWLLADAAVYLRCSSRG
jgi:hypothetical protein